MTEKLCHSDSLTRMKRTIKELCEVTGCKDELLVLSLCTWTYCRIKLERILPVVGYLGLCVCMCLLVSMSG